MFNNLKEKNETKEKLAADLLKAFRNIPNWPEEGVQFKDISTVLKDPKLSSRIFRQLHDYVYQNRRGMKGLAGVETRGFIYGPSVAMVLGVPFIMTRKPGKLPFKTVSHKYNSEYGSGELQMHVDALSEGDEIHVHDDILAKGGTALATAELIEKLGGKVHSFSFIGELSFLNGRALLQKKYPEADIFSIVEF